MTVGLSDTAGPAPLWHAVDRLTTRAPSVAELRLHRLEPFAARLWRGAGVPVPEPVAQEERFAAVASLAAPALLARVRDAVDGPIVVMKGAEIAGLYPDPALRSFRDVDLLVEDAEAAQRALLAAGFEEFGDAHRYVGIHHLRPLVARDLPVGIEVHSRPKWVDRLPSPDVGLLLESAVPGRTGIEGILGLPPAMHALVLAAHSWAHEPLRRIRDLVDVAAAWKAAGEGEVDALAGEWGVERLWATTRRMIENVFGHDRVPWSFRPWSRHLLDARERTVFEAHATRWLSPGAGLPRRAAIGCMAETLAAEVKPAPDEGWPEKLRRMGMAVVHARYARTHHERLLDDDV